MSTASPIYTAQNCTVAYQLHWAISLFAHEPLPDLAKSLEGVRPALEADGVRILEHRAASPSVVQFWVSTRPDLAPAKILQLLKGRLQHALRDERPKAFRRNYRLESVGSTKGDVIQAYVAKQAMRHRMADPRVQERMIAVQIDQPDVDLTGIRYSAHGQFIYNLHVVLEHEDGWCAADEEFFRATREMVLGICRKKHFLLSKAGIIADHLHVAIGCGVEDAPADVALSFLNNLAYAHGMKPIYRFSFYVGTFGGFDLGALRHACSLQAACHRGKLGGDGWRRVKG